MNSVRLLKEATSSPDWQAHYSAICKLSSGKFQLKFFIDGLKANGYRGILAHGVIFIASFWRIISYPIKNSMATGIATAYRCILRYCFVIWLSFFEYAIPFHSPPPPPALFVSFKRSVPFCEIINRVYFAEIT